MSAPEPQVHLTSEREQQMRAWRYTRPDGVGIRPIFLDELVDNTATLARLQARWDARDEALRELVEKWRQRADEAAASSDGDDDAEATYYHRYACASELERAIGDGR